MHTGDKVLVILVLFVACCFLLPFAPGAIRRWVDFGPGALLLPVLILGLITWTIGKR